MSGYYESTARLARIAAAISAAHTRRQAVARGAAATVATIDRLAARIAATQSESASVRAGLLEMAQNLETLRVRATDACSLPHTIAVPGRPSETSETGMAQVSAQLADVEARQEALGNALASVAGDYERAIGSDAAAVAIRQRVFELEKEMASAAELLQRWRPSEWEALGASVRTQVSAVEESLQASLANAAGAAALEPNKVAVERDFGRLAALRSEAEAVESAHQQRLYVLKGLRDVCARLGFDETEAPYYEAGPSSAIMLKVDTRVKGRIVFKLGIDSRIETDSEIDPKYCPSEFGRLSEALDEAYGVQAQFVHSSEDSTPDRRTWDAKDVPTGKKPLAASEGA